MPNIQNPEDDADLLRRMKLRLEYDPETGLFRAAKGSRQGGNFGGQPGYKNPKGYHVLSVYGKAYKAHRLAWFYVYGVWPEGQIDHINGNRTDNRICNLRDVPQGVNMQNQRKAMRHSKSGLLGVTTTRKGTFVSAIKKNDKCTYLGTFPTPELAHAAYIAAKRKLHPGCTI